MTAHPRPPILRPAKYVSDKIRQSARGEACTLRLECCSFNDEETVFAHIRQASHAGMARKPPDFWGVYACAACHREQARLQSSELCGYDDVLRALFLTQSRLFAKGLLQMQGDDEGEE